MTVFGGGNKLRKYNLLSFLGPWQIRSFATGSAWSQARPALPSDAAVPPVATFSSQWMFSSRFRASTDIHNNHKILESNFPPRSLSCAPENLPALLAGRLHWMPLMPLPPQAGMGLIFTPGYGLPQGWTLLSTQMAKLENWATTSPLLHKCIHSTTSSPTAPNPNLWNPSSSCQRLNSPLLLASTISNQTHH